MSIDATRMPWRRGYRAAAALLACLLAGGWTPPTAAQAAIASTVPETRRSGFDFMGPATQAMQRDDDRNPGMLWVQDGQASWTRAPGNGGKACVVCHAAAQSSMAGVAARYPAFDAALARPVTLGQRIDLCRQRHQGLQALAPEDDVLLGLEAFVAHQSRGQPITPPEDPRLAPFTARGRALFGQRMGQLNLSCRNCHDDNAGRRLGGSTIPEGHATGYPIYRLEWQALGSLQRRLRACISGVRSEPFAADATEWAALELYLAQRARGMPLETPAVRP